MREDVVVGGPGVIVDVGEVVGVLLGFIVWSNGFGDVERGWRKR